MSEWFLDISLYLITNIQVLLINPTGSVTITILKMFCIMLLLRFGIKLILHCHALVRLKKKFNVYDKFNIQHIRPLFSSLCKKNKMRRMPSLHLFSDSKPLIFSIGTFRPAVFLSPRLIFDLSPDELRAALIHELKHIKRHDSAWLWLFDFFLSLIPVVIIVLFGFLIIFHIVSPYPFIMLAVFSVLFFSVNVKKRLIFSREKTCDDLTIQMIKDPLLLASTLVKVWRIGSRLPRYNFMGSLFQVRPFITSTKSLEQRIKRLTDYKHPPGMTRFKKVLVCLSVIAFAAVSIFFWEFSSFYMKANIKSGEGRILVKTTEPSMDSRNPVDAKDRKIIKRKHVYKK